MLNPQDRVILHEALTPPSGFVLDEGIGTTYSLDLVTLLSTPLAFTLFDWEDTAGHPTSNLVLLLEGLRRHIGKLSIFCQAGRIAAPKSPNPLFAYLEEAVIEVQPKNGPGIFHPKVWLIRYRQPETGAIRYRVLCLSRNLTADRSWDLSLTLEGPLVDRKNAFAVNHPLGDFIAALPGLAVRSAPASAIERVTRMAEEVRRVDFLNELPDPFDALDFHPLGIDGHRRDPLGTSGRRGLVISPFVDAGRIRELGEGASGSVLVSRSEELDRLPQGALAGFERVYVLSDNAGRLTVDGAEDEVEKADGLPEGLHAKLFLRERGRECSLFVGSANATTAAFQHNVEFLIELGGSRSRLGVDQLLRADEDQASLLSLLVPYEPPPVPTDDPVERVLDNLLDQCRRAMVGAGWEFQASPGPGVWGLDLVRGPDTAFHLPDGVRLRVWPITLPEASSARPILADTNRVGFADLSTGALTTFLSCEALATVEERSASTRFALNLPLVGAPAGRRETVLRQVLDDPQKVLRFLEFLLADEQALPPGVLDDAAPESQAGGGGWNSDTFVLLESLLRALAHDPGRLDEVASLLKDLGADEDARRRIPEGLLRLWPAIWAAREEIPR